MPLSTTNKAAYQHYKSSLQQYFHVAGKNYDKETWITTDCDECSTCWQNNIDFFVNMKTIAKKTLSLSFVTHHSQGNFVIEIRQISWSCPDPIFFKNKYPNPILIRKIRKYPAGYLILSMLTSVPDAFVYRCT